MFNRKIMVNAGNGGRIYLTGFFLALACLLAIAFYDFKRAQAPQAAPPSPAIPEQAKKPAAGLSPRARLAQKALAEGTLKLRPARFYETLEQSKT